MKILMVVTLVSPLGEFGGPLRVALNQARALTALGHDVTVAGAYKGYRVPPAEVDGIAAKLFPAVRLLPRSGFSGIAAPKMLWWIISGGNKFDAVHIHVSRDLVTLPVTIIRALRRKPYVLQPHGMIDPSNRLLARPLDFVATRPALRNARRVFYLTTREKQDLLNVAGSRCGPLFFLPNGVPLADEASRCTTDVLYLARLAARKNPTVYVAAAERLSAEFPSARFSLVGPDEGEGDKVSHKIEAAAARGGANIVWEGSIAPQETVARMQRASIYVLPAVDEPYPMSVLEAMSVGLPVVVTKSCGLAETIQNANAGVVIDPGPAALETALRRLLSDPKEAIEMGRRGMVAVRKFASMRAVAESLQSSYSV